MKIWKTLSSQTGLVSLTIYTKLCQKNFLLIQWLKETTKVFFILGKKIEREYEKQKAYYMQVGIERRQLCYTLGKKEKQS